LVAGMGGAMSSTGGAVSGTGGMAIPGTGGASTGGASAAGTGGLVGSSSTGGRAMSSTGGMVAEGGGNGTGRGSGGAGIMGGAGGVSAMGAAFAPVAMILGTSCGTGNCHQAGPHIDLRNNATLHARLVGAMPNGTNTMAACKMKTMVVPSDLTMSVLSQIVKAAVPGCSNGRMPDDCSPTGTNPRPCLTAAQIATIDGWIMAGAPP